MSHKNTSTKKGIQHEWQVSPREARAIQERLRDSVITQCEVGKIHHVAGVDVGFENRGETTRAVVASLGFPDLQLQEYSLARMPTQFPYVPGLLSFREIPAILKALEGLKNLPEVLICDGQGLAHPRRLGVASHLGVLTGLPSIGVAKTRLVGTHNEVPDKRGAWVPLKDHDEIIGAVLRTRQGVKPVYVSIGHKVDLEFSIKLVMQCTTRYRLPETTRWADGIASRRPGWMRRLQETLPG
jgi:deoxyribonuclease V